MNKQFCIIQIKNGEIVNKGAIRKLLALKDGRYLFEISGADKRSDPQNRYYWGIVIVLIRQAMNDKGNDYSKEEIHEFLKAEFNYNEIVNEDSGEIKKVPISTTRLNKEDFSKYIEKIQRWAAEWLQIVIPDPGVQTVFSYEV